MADFDEDTELEDYPGLHAAARFARMIPDVPWFASLGRPFAAAEILAAEGYLANLGFPDARLTAVPDWEDAEEAARNPDWNTEWWEAEEQLRAGLTAEAAQLSDEETLNVVLTLVAQRASEIVHGRAAAAGAAVGGDHEALIRAAAGAATQACYQAALVLAAEAEEDHPFALKYRLFEAGRWPLGIVGQTFHLF